MLISLFQAIPAALLLLVSAVPAAADEREVDRQVVLDLDSGDELMVADGEPLLRSGRPRGYIGVRSIAITPELREHYGAPRDAGVLVGGVESDSPAGRAGIRVGDVITIVDGERIDSVRDLSRAVRAKKKGDEIQVEIARERGTRKLTVSVEDRAAGMDLRGLGRGLRGRKIVLPDFDLQGDFLQRLPEIKGLDARLEDLEKRLKELEKRLPAR